MVRICLSHICIGWQKIQNWQDILTNDMIRGNQRKHGHYAPLCVEDTQHTPWVEVYQVLPHLLFTQGPRRAQCNQVDCSHPQLRTVGSHRRPPDDSALKTCHQMSTLHSWNVGGAVSIPEHTIDFKWHMFGYPALMLGKYIGTDNPQRWTNCFVHLPCMQLTKQDIHQPSGHNQTLKPIHDIGKATLW